MDKRMVDSSKSLVDNAAQFDKSLKELRDFSCQLYHAADFCKTAFMNSQDKTLIVETTKEYIYQAVVTVVDHLGSISANLEYCMYKSNFVPQTEHKIDSLRQRIGTCQQYSQKLALPRFHLTAEFSRYHCRYISLPLKDSALMTAVSRDPESCIDAKGGEENQAETNTYNCKQSLVESSNSDMEKKNGFSPPVNTTRYYKKLLPVHDGLSILSKAEHSTFQFQEAQKPKLSTIKWKVMQNKDISSLIRRGKRILA